MEGGSADDDMDGGSGDDTMFGEVGDDYMEGGTGSDDMYGGRGNDEMLGGDDDDYLDGGSGQDDLDGDAGNDELYGNDGEDFLDGGAGNDMLTGGTGGDVFEVHLTYDGETFASTYGPESDVITDFNFSEDNDLLTFVIDDNSGSSAGELFNALNAATSVSEVGGSTMISVGSSVVTLSGVTAGEPPFEFDSLETINDITDGNYMYEAVDIVQI